MLNGNIAIVFNKSGTNVSIVALQNAGTGTHFLATIKGKPKGNVSFFVSRTPDFSNTFTVSAEPTSQSDTLQLRVPEQGGWFVWAADGRGNTPFPLYIWVGIGDTAEMDFCARYITALIEKHREVIEAGLRADGFHDPVIKSISYGRKIDASLITGYPFIFITKPKQEAQFVDRSDDQPDQLENLYELQIYCFLLHQGKMSHLELIKRTATRIVDLLNAPENTPNGNRFFPTPSQQLLAASSAEQGESDETRMEDGRYLAIGSVIWSATGLERFSIS